MTETDDATYLIAQSGINMHINHIQGTWRTRLARTG